MKYKIALVGFGVVGQGFAELLFAKRKQLLHELNCEFVITAICDVQKGTLYNKDGIDLEYILGEVRGTGKISDIKVDSLEFIKATDADIIVEVSYTDISTGQPALDHIRTALQCKKHVVTTNKGPIALAFNELRTLARQNDVCLRYEGTVMSGTPVVSTAQYGLAGCTIHEVRGIFNGTTNFILTEMENGKSYEEALALAQQNGYAEANPTGDVEGFDTLAKVLILSNVIFGKKITPNDVSRKGIVGITRQDIMNARDEGMRWKLIGSIKFDGAHITASVAPEKIPVSDPLANVMGVSNSITFISDELGITNITGAGAGKKETGYALLSDVIDIHRTITR